MGSGSSRCRNSFYNSQVNVTGPEAGTPEAPEAAKKPDLVRRKIPVPLIPFPFLSKRPKQSLRAVLRVPVSILSAILVVVGVVSLALQWKSAHAWEKFLQTFVTSPAAAGTAAVLAAVIAAITFNRGLQHTKAEARDKAWWEKFEWVTDRIVPKDPKQERLASGLAFSLLESLEAASDEGFQRKAIEGIKQTYIQGQQTDLSKAKLGELRAQFREVRTFADSSWHSGKVSHEIRSYAYRLANSVALLEAWDAGKVELDPKLPLQPRPPRRDTITALLGNQGKPVMVLTRYTTMYFSAEAAFHVFQRVKPLMEINDVSALIIVTNDYVPDDRSWLSDLPAVGVVYWEHEHGPEALRDRIRFALREVVSLQSLSPDGLEGTNV
ncbi:hypothetical protein NG819_19880 [Pseudarthrobacter sp. Fe7]|nr:hypothetical protein NG819_19880 [Pseudarthrobacter sp. Fe7]